MSLKQSEAVYVLHKTLVKAMKKAQDHRNLVFEVQSLLDSVVDGKDAYKFDGAERIVKMVEGLDQLSLSELHEIVDKLKAERFTRGK